MLRAFLGVRNALAALRRDRGATAGLEFALTAPIMIVLVLATYDIARACIAWEEVCETAGGVAQAAEKLSYSSTSSTTTLTSTQIQEAMSTIYADMPGLKQGNGGGSEPGDFAVTLSSVVFLTHQQPNTTVNNTTGTNLYLCTTATTTTNTTYPNSDGCGTMMPYVLWSAALAEPISLSNGTATLPAALQVFYRACNTALTPVSRFPNDSNQLADMIGQDVNNAGILPTPQVVADVQYTFTPFMTQFIKLPITFRASATFPAPIGGLNQMITYTSGANDDFSVRSCPLTISSS